MKKKKHIRILLLMITSQMLLILFVAQWLRTQYSNEKEKLVVEMNRIYLDTQDEMIDTLLLHSYVMPVIAAAGSEGSKSVFVATDTLRIGTNPDLQKDIKQGAIYWKGAGNAVTVSINSSGDSLPNLHDTIRIRRSTDDILLRSMRLIVAHTTGPDTGERSDLIRLNLKIDSVKFTEQFGDKISNAGMKFNISWQQDDHRAINVNPMNPLSLPGAAVTNYSAYLLNRILPQILFGLILVLITALAFFLSYRSIRDHLIMNSMRNEFINNITHELRTPVTTISVALESLGKFSNRNDQAMTGKYLGLASAETKRLEELIERVLDISLLEDDTSPLNLTLTDINSVIAGVADIMTQRLDKGGSIEFVPSSGSPITNCDPLLLKGALINLVENSIRYCNKIPEIKISAEKTEETIVIMVSDNGPGIAPEYIGKIFEKFFRLPSGNVHNVKGYGLGLSFVSQVMKLHKGSVSVRNLTQGCCFTLKIPSS